MYGLEGHPFVLHERSGDLGDPEHAENHSNEQTNVLTNEVKCPNK